MTRDYSAALQAAVQAARMAGELLREEFYRHGGPRGSGDHALIDEGAEKTIREKLLSAFSWSYLGEETGAHAGTDPSHRWLVDPHDGTSACLEGWRGTSVSIALLREVQPVLGVVYAFNEPDDAGDLIAWAEGCGPITRNGRPVHTDLAGAGPQPGAVVFLSQEADGNPVANSACVAPARYIVQPSIAYRLARVAAGDGVAAVSLRAPGAWDYAAGHALLRAAGGIVADERGTEVAYGRDGRSATRWCFGGAAAVVQQLCRRDWETALAPAGTPGGPLALARPSRGRAARGDGMLARAQGCLLGQLAGDSLGGLVEFSPVQVIARQYPQGVRDLHDGGHWGLLAGQPTDDSELALLLARVLVREQRYDPGAALEAYVGWFRDPHTFDTGGTTAKALGAAARGTNRAQRLELVEAHADKERASNGSLMRISPLGIFTARRPDEAAALARAESRLTHPSPACQDACAVLVASIATTIAHGGGPACCYETGRADAARPGVLPAVREAVEKARHEAPADYQSQMGWVLIALQNAYYQLLHATSLEDGLIDTVMRGGDTDTNAAIAGALLGAVHGRKAIPARWLHRVLSCRPLPGTPTNHPRAPCYWPVDALLLAEALLCAGAPVRSQA